MRLVQFAFFNNDRLAELEALAAEEFWGDGNGRPYATLNYYCEANFEIAYAQGRIYFDSAKQCAIWRVGSLISRDGRPLYAYFTKNTRDNSQEYRLSKFLASNWDGSLAVPHVGMLRDLPREQDYDEMEKYQPDFRIQADDWGYLLRGHQDRLRKVLPRVDQPRVLQLILSGAFEEVHRLSRFAEKIIPQYFIPKFREFAPPPYHPGSFQHLAPLYINEQPDSDKAPDLVAPLERDSKRDVYVVKTLLPPEWAYRTARCVAKDNTRLRPWIAAAHGNGQTTDGPRKRGAQPTNAGKIFPVSAPPYPQLKPPSVEPAPVAPATPEEAAAAVAPKPAPALPPAAIEPLPSHADLATSHHAPAPAAHPDAEPTTVLDNLGQRPASNRDDLDQALETLAAQQTAEKSPAEWLELGRAHYKAGRFKEAALACSQAVQGDAYYADAYCLKGDALRQLGDNARALDAYRGAFSVNPGLTHAYLGIGHTYQNMGNFTRAVIAYDEAIRQAPDEPFAYVFKSQALKNLDDDAEGIKALDCAIEKKPDYAFAWYLKGEALTRLGRLDEAHLAFQEASRLGYKQ